MQFLESLSGFDIILASQSPRRKELLAATNIPFRVWALPVDESFPDHFSPIEVAEYLCKQKASAFRGKLARNSIVITADTIVVKNNAIMNKASDEEEACNMLRKLSGTDHEVITGVCLYHNDVFHTFHEITKVYFRKLDESEISYYIKNFKPFDKAGAYGIQEWIGSVAVTKIEGSYYNVVGLPVSRLYDKLKEIILT